MDMGRPGKRFVYICSATPNQIVNILPLLQVGPDAVDCILMLVGVHQPPTERDQQMALGHIKIFNRVLKEIASRKEIPEFPTVETIQNPPDDTRRWQQSVARKLARLGVGDKEPLLNVTGGTRSMMFGAMAGIRDAQNDEQQPSPPWNAVIHLTEPARTEQLLPTVEKAPDYLTGGIETLTLSEHLSLQNYEERETPARRIRETNARCRTTFTRALVQDMSRGVPQWQRNVRAGVLHRIVNDAEMAAKDAGRDDHEHRTVDFTEFDGPNSNGRGRRAHNAGNFWMRIFEEMQKVPDLYTSDTGAGTISFIGKAGTAYFTGGWFEEYLFLRCEEILRHRKDVKVHLGVSYGDVTDAEVGTDGEIDVVIQVENNLHLIECKAGRVANSRNPDGVDRSAIHTIASRRRLIAGPKGSGRLVSFQSGVKPFLESLKQEAAHNQVTAWFGSDGLRDFEAWLRRLCRSR